MFGPRIRRIKCDEKKPSCDKCTSTGRTCDGYTVKPEASRDTLACSQLAPVWAQSIPQNLSVGIEGDHAERQGFHFFQSYVWPELSGQLQSAFWERLILQASHADAAIRHAAIAFGSLGERLLINNVMTFDNENANRLHNFACSQYYKAIKELRKQLSSGHERSVESALITCFIFICFDFLQGNECTALTHLKSGIEILRRSGFRGVPLDPNGPALPLTEPADFGSNVASMFGVLDRSAAYWMATPTFGMPLPSINNMDYRSLCLEGFPNIDVAEDYLKNLDGLLNCTLPAWANAQSDPTAFPRPLSRLISSRDEIFKAAHNWSCAMDVLMARSSHEFSVQESQRATTMIIHHRVSSLRLTASCQESEEDFYRNSDPEFSYIVSKSTPLLRPIDAMVDFRASHDRNSERLFSFCCSIIHPLYFTAVHCHDPEIRREALSLLSTSPWREGAWDSAAMARIAERRIRQREPNLSYNNTQPTSHVTTGPEIMGYDLQGQQYHVGGSFKFPQDRITELSDSDRSF